MNFRTFCKKYSSVIIALFIVTTLYLVIGFRYDMHYELNDDTMMRNILSGSYTGHASPRCYFMLYPLGILLSLLYRVIPFVQWYDVFLITCQFVCLFLVLVRLMKICRGQKEKIITVFLWVFIVIIYLLNYLVFVTFTVTGGLMAATAVFLFVTEEDRENLFRKSVPSIILIAVAFCIRYMVIPMMLPFICIGGIYQWSKEKEILSKDNIKKYFGIFGTIVISLAFLFIADKIAYSSNEWKMFKEFCEDRANVYDYQYVPLYEDNKDFYNKNNISYEQYLLLRSYDFGLDEDIDAEVMSALLDYSNKTGPDLKEKFNIALGAYRIQITDKIGTPYHTLILVGYILLMLSINRRNWIKIIVLEVMILISRSIIWLYLLGQGRVVSRVIHPLYWAEFILLAAISLTEVSYANKNYKKYILYICTAVLCAVTFTSSFTSFNTKYESLQSKALQHEAVQSYCLENEDNFYLVPVYSIGVLPEKVFDGNKEPENMELLGGWLVKSPVYRQKLSNYDIDRIDDALIYKDNVYIIQHNDYVSYDTEYPFQWLTSYYKGKGYNVEVIKTDVIVDNIEVHKVEKVN